MFKTISRLTIAGMRQVEHRPGNNTTRGYKSQKGKNLGVRVLYEPPTGTVAVVDIVFVHGLTGNAYDTWLHEKSGIHWPSQLLEEDIKDARIMSFGYDADVVRWFSAASVNRVGNHAEALLGALARQRERTDSDDRKIIFVMHSLGGLVVQNALALSRSSREAHLQKIEANTVGLAFLGTPNFGSNLASWANYGTHLLNMVKRTNKDIVNVLEPDSEVLAIIQKRFHELLFMRQSQPIKISCFHEELPQGALGVIVGMESATLPPYPCYPIHASHSDMTKFQDRDCPGYNTVMGELWRWAKAVHNEASRNAASQAGMS
ncbi:putative SesB-related regulatory protein [Periconia macrospinosa]|uniref:Putative SesB-related regulatory protein n=1 Tax=Periconia macrospinosa TaxID=97972 RepID=A0A2V1E372_9PLEO|nr:putative SesB-related regulatory protein [Periconia macrospinosa]